MRYTVKHWDRPGKTLRLASFAGVETPTGRDTERDELGRLPQPLQLGSGSWDPFGGMILTWQTLQWEFDAAASFQFNTEANGYQSGSEARMNSSFQYRVWLRDLGKGVPHFLYGVIESNAVWGSGRIKR